MSLTPRFSNTQGYRHTFGWVQQSCFAEIRCAKAKSNIKHTIQNVNYEHPNNREKNALEEAKHLIIT